MTSRNKFSMADFVSASRNHLILIVSLIVLICLFVGIAATSRSIETVQRWILIGFVIVFAVFGTGISVWLLLRETRRAVIGKANKEFGWLTSSTENQRRKLNEEVREISARLKSSNPSDLFLAFIVAEDLALRQIQQETGEPLLRNMSVGGADFDAILLKQDVITCIEVAFIVAPDVSQIKINDMLRRIAVAAKTFERIGKNPKIKLLLVLITQLDPRGEAELRSILVDKFSATSTDIDVRLFDFENLQKIYAEI